ARSRIRQLRRHHETQPDGDPALPSGAREFRLLLLLEAGSLLSALQAATGTASGVVGLVDRPRRTDAATCSDTPRRAPRWAAAADRSLLDRGRRALPAEPAGHRVVRCRLVSQRRERSEEVPRSSYPYRSVGFGRGASRRTEIQSRARNRAK